jgi:hypothetical protein
METLLFFLLIIALGGALTLLIVYVRERSGSLKRDDLVQQQLFAADRARHDAIEQAKKLHAEVARLQPWKGVADASAKAGELIREAAARAESIERDARILRDSAQGEYERQVGVAKDEAKQIVAAAKQKAEGIETNAQQLSAHANRQAAAIIEEAERQAKLTAGKAFDAVKNAEQYERIVNAMRNRIEGYGDRYIVPASSFLDALAEEMSHKEAGQSLKRCRSQSAAMVKAGEASTCDYAEANRRESAERFVVDAFNGRVDSILSRAKHDNYGTLHQEILDAFDLVNFNGRAFRDAQVTQAYLFARQEELRWACIAQELKRQEQEEQRQIREQIREEEKARRDYERAIREAAKEEERVRTAMAKAQAQLAEASEAQRSKYEAQLAELSARLQLAEERGQRAISMAQLTKRGHVYVISNLGSFGEHVYKIGLTRRLDPMDRIWELGDASVPFDFDVHAMILSDDAPALERRLHQHFLLNQVNKVNHRKEFFRVAAADLRKELEQLGVVAQFTMLAEAKEYRETQAIERQIAENPGAREAWLNRQFQLDPVKDEDREPVAAGVSEEDE